MEKSAGIALEFKDLDTSKRTAVIKHAVYTSIDKVGDISTKGMFTKSWNEGKPDFLFNHQEGKTVGSVLKNYEDDSGAYTEVKFGGWTLGNDVLEMADEGVLKGASFGYKTINKQFVDIKGQKIRKLTEVKHLETSLLSVLPAHPEAGIVVLNKAFDKLELKQLTPGQKSTLKSVMTSDLGNVQSLTDVASKIDPNSDLFGFLMQMVSQKADACCSMMNQMQADGSNDNDGDEMGAQMDTMKSYVKSMEAFLAKTKISDETIISLQNGLIEYKKIISDYDTALTELATQPIASDDGVKKQISNYLTSFNLRQWQRKPLVSN